MRGDRAPVRCVREVVVDYVQKVNMSLLGSGGVGGCHGGVLIGAGRRLVG